MENEIEISVRLKHWSAVLFGWQLRKLEKRLKRANAQADRCRGNIKRASAELTALTEKGLELHVDR